MARRKRVPAEAFAAAVKDTLEKYGDDVRGNMGEIVQDVTKAGAKALRAASRSAVNGKEYASGWAARLEIGRLTFSGIVYNKKKPGLPHLLEFGHVTRNGTGRVFNPTPAHPHIKEVEEKMIQEFETKVVNEL